MPWQLRAFSYYDSIGELRYASHFYARQLSRVRFYPARLKDDGTTEPIKDGPPVEILNRIQDPGGGRSQLQYNYGRLMFVTGEGVLFGSRLQTEEERWKFLWKDEVKIREDGSAVRMDMNHKETDEVGIAYRLWNPHPRHSDEADSPLRAIMDIAEELIHLTSSVMGTATTRKTNGMLLIPSDLSPNRPEPSGDEDPENNIFLADFIEHVQSQIENPASPESKVPFLLEASGEFLEQVRWIPLHDPATDYMEKDLRMEAIKRLALGLDMPPEILLGMADANHWTAKQVQHDVWRSHGMPKAEQFADDLSEAYLRPALREAEFDDWSSVVIAYDDSQVVISPDRTEDADKALDRVAINRSAYRELKGFSEDMKPNEEEEALLIALRMRNPALLGIDVPQRGPLASPNGNAPAEEGPTEPTQGREVSRPESRTASAEILGAAALALNRCRELAGVRIRRNDESIAPGIPLPLIASVLGPEKVTDPLKLVKGGTAGYCALLEGWGFEPSQAESLAQTLEVYAARTLYEPRQPELPAGFLAQVEKAKETSDALVR